MRCRLIILLAACVDAPPLHEPVIEASHVEIKENDEAPIPKLDVLIFIDDTIAMRPYANRLASLPAMIARELRASTLGWHDLHVAVTSNDGKLRRLDTDTRFVTEAIDLQYRRYRNYASSLDDALTAMMNVGTDNTGASQPLAAIMRALETNGDLLREDHMGLAVIVVSAADDASPSSVEEYVTWMRAVTRGQWRRHLTMISLIPQPAPRIDEYYAKLHAFPKPMSIDADAYGAVISGLRWAPMHWQESGPMCLFERPLDRDPSTSEIEPDCEMFARADYGGHTIPQCRGANGDDRDDGAETALPTEPCWFLRRGGSYYCWDQFVIDLEGYTSFTHPALRLECRTR